MYTKEQLEAITEDEEKRRLSIWLNKQFERLKERYGS